MGIKRFSVLFVSMFSAFFTLTFYNVEKKLQTQMHFLVGGITRAFLVKVYILKVYLYFIGNSWGSFWRSVGLYRYLLSYGVLPFKFTFPQLCLEIFQHQLNMYKNLNVKTVYTRFVAYCIKCWLETLVRNVITKYLGYLYFKSFFKYSFIYAKDLQPKWKVLSNRTCFEM